MALNIQNPILELQAAALQAFPDLDCDLVFSSFPDEGPYGQTIWPHDGSRTQVEVAVGIPMEGVLDVMAHELAHVAVGPGKGHGEEWESAFEAIHGAYARRMRESYERPGSH